MILHPKESSEPDLCIGGFEMWVYGRQFPESDDYWDGNWLMITARCTANSAVVEAGGPILHLSELRNLLLESKQMHASLSGEAHLCCMEPNLDLKIKMESMGRCQLMVSITPDNLYQQHSFTFDLDQSYLPSLINQLERLLKYYSFKGPCIDGEKNRPLSFLKWAKKLFVFPLV